MPRRYLRETILDSEPVNALSPQAEVFYRRLMSVVDDYGLFDARPRVLRSRLYALQLDKVRETDLERWIAECVKAGLMRLYESNGKPFIEFFKLGAPRTLKPRWPVPPDWPDLPEPDDPARTCAQTRANGPYSVSVSETVSIARSDAGAGEPARAQAAPENPESRGRGHSSSPSPLRGGGRGEGSSADAATLAALLKSKGITDPDYAEWGERIAALLGWLTPRQKSAIVVWHRRLGKATAAELHAAADDLAARTEPLKWANQVLPAINASIQRQRDQAKRKEPSLFRVPFEPPSPEERAAMSRQLAEAKARLGAFTIEEPQR